jgi:hypothetical protein
MTGLPHDPSVFSWNKVLVFNLGFDRKGPTAIHWMYFPSASCRSTVSASTTTSSAPIG